MGRKNMQYTDGEADRALAYLRNREAAAARVGDTKTQEASLRRRMRGDLSEQRKAEIRADVAEQLDVQFGKVERPRKRKAVVVPAGEVWTKAEIEAEAKRLRDNARFDAEVARVKSAVNPQRARITKAQAYRAAEFRRQFRLKAQEAIAEYNAEQAEMRETEERARRAVQSHADAKAARLRAIEEEGAYKSRMLRTFGAEVIQRGRREAELLTGFNTAEDQRAFYKALSAEDRDLLDGILLRFRRGH